MGRSHAPRRPGASASSVWRESSGSALPVPCGCVCVCVEPSADDAVRPTEEEEEDEGRHAGSTNEWRTLAGC